MKFKATTAMVIALVISLPALALADPDDDTLVLNGETANGHQRPPRRHTCRTHMDTIYVRAGTSGLG